jgi:hypothetical protein
VIVRLLAYLFVAVGFVLTFVAVYLIARTGDKSQYMVVWGLGLLTIMLGLKSLPKKKKHKQAKNPNRIEE